jgi:Flp pilus assembly pilin Flp
VSKKQVERPLEFRAALKKSDESAKPMKKISIFIKNEVGAELAEYAVAVALLVAVAIVVYNVLGAAIADQNSGTGAQVKGVPRSFPF